MESTVLIDGETGRDKKIVGAPIFFAANVKVELHKSELHSDSAEPTTTCMNPVPDIEKT
jgi:hypothetical protein